MVYRATILIGVFGLLCTFWLYARFTVDDAFITWRYGKNLVEHGVWNYNPSFFDLTQAYTNPIYAVLSIIPHTFNLSTVLFFKILALLNIIIFSIWYLRATNQSYITLLLLISLPVTQIHIFGGLETFLYVSILGALFVCLDKHNLKWSLALTLTLFMIRPETWMLAALIPPFFLIKKTNTNPLNFNLKPQNIISLIRTIKVDKKSATIAAIILTAPLIGYLIVNKIYFGYALPNTFYAKSNASFSLKNFAIFTFFITPIVVIGIIGRIKISFLLTIYCVAIIINYSTSDLQMNYSARFAYHIFVPIYIFLVYASSQHSNAPSIIKSKRRFFETHTPIIIKTIAVAYLLALFLLSGGLNPRMITYYPRGLDSHAAFGKELSKIKDQYQLKSFALGDAGMAPYHSGLLALDSVGLGSGLVTQTGLTDKLMDEYDLDLIAFYSNSEGIRLSIHNQESMLNWAQSNQLIYLCDLYWQPDYTLTIYARVELPELVKVCNDSFLKNDRNDGDYINENWKIPPWVYWTN